MSYNKYNTRHSGRYNTPGQFTSGGELQPAFQTPRKPNNQQQQQNLQPIQPAADIEMKQEQPQQQDVNMGNDGQPSRPHWMKSKLGGIRKLSNKERRRRQNENLRRLLTPKNALMVLNEMLPNEQFANQFKVEPAATTQYFNKSQNTHNFCADLTLEGNSYKGYGENKLSARNAAAELAIRDLIIKKMNKTMSNDGSVNGESPEDEDTLPMIQLASFALHKLFAEWEYEGHKVPQLKPNNNSTSESAEAGGAGPGPGAGGGSPAPKPRAVKKAKDVPENAAAMHPCMLLTYMRPHLEYHELATEGDRPQNMTFTMGVNVDGATFVGKAANKKEARRMAAQVACQTLFGVKFTNKPTENVPVVKE